MRTTDPGDAARIELLLAELRLPAIKLVWASLAAQADKEGWSAGRFLVALAEHEIAERSRRRLERHLAEARLPPGKTLDSFDFEAVPVISKAQVMALAAGDAWLNNGANLLLFGPPGGGKSHLAAALGFALVENGWRVLFTRTIDLVQRLQIARRELALEAAIAIAERLLSITGEDALTIDRKHMSAWTGRLQIRFLIYSNELPRIADASGALASRFIVLLLTISFLGREDLGLEDRVLPELPGILNWAIAGLRRLRARGRFMQPASATEAMQYLADLASPVGAFVRERCNLGPGLQVERSRLFQAYVAWRKSQGEEHPVTEELFGRNLRSAVPSLSTTRPRTDGSRLRLYEGIALRRERPGGPGGPSKNPL